MLYEKYRDQGLFMVPVPFFQLQLFLYFLILLIADFVITGFEILAFPCNQFGWQEQGTNEEIQETACTMFKAEFPIFEKVTTQREEEWIGTKQ